MDGYGYIGCADHSSLLTSTDYELDLVDGGGYANCDRQAIEKGREIRQRLGLT